MWCYIDMSHCEWAVCGYEGFLVLVSLLYVGIVRFVIRLKYIPVAAGRLSSLVGRYRITKPGLSPGFVMHNGIPIAIVRLRHKKL